jgi:phage terminase large subunit-like protein
MTNLRAERRRRAREDQSLLAFWEAWREKKYITEPHDRARYTSIQITLENGQNLIVDEPPRSGKSEAICVFSVAWFLATHPNFKFGLITHSQALANKFVTAVAALLTEMGFEFEYVRANEFKLKGSLGIDPSFWGSGIEGGHTGKGCNRLILSDILRSGTDAQSQKVREGIITNVISTAMNRGEPYTADDGSVIPFGVTIEQARLHAGDPVGWFLKESQLPYVQCHFPATNDDGHSAWVKDTYTNTIQFTPAYAALTQRQPREVIDSIQGYSSGYYFTTQYLQVIPSGSSLYFDLERCPRYDQQYVDVWWAACDFANTATNTGSRSAFGAMGFNRSTGQLLKLCARAGRYRADEMGDEMMSFLQEVNRMTGLQPQAVIVERAAGGYAIIDRYGSVLPQLVAVSPGKSKEEHAGGVCYIVNQGQVALPQDGATTWLKEWIEEVGQFPLALLNDQTDVFCYLLDYAVRPSLFQPVVQESIVEYDALAESHYRSSFEDMNRFDERIENCYQRRF